MDALTERTPRQYITGFMLTVALPLAAATFSSPPPSFFLWDSYQFVLILPHPVVVVWKLRCRQGEKMCVCVCVCPPLCVCVCVCVCLFFVRQREGGRGKEKEEKSRRGWQVGVGRGDWSGFLSVSQEECLARNEMPTKWGRIRGPSVSHPEPPLLSTEDGWDRSSWERGTERERRKHTLALIYTLTFYTHVHRPQGHTHRHTNVYYIGKKWQFYKHPRRGDIHVRSIHADSLPLE